MEFLRRSFSTFGRGEDRMPVDTQAMIVRCREAGFMEPEFALLDGFMTIVRRPSMATGIPPEVTPEVTPEVARLLSVLNRDMGRAEIIAALGLRDEKHFRGHYQQAAIAAGVVEMTIPDKPKSRLQKYRLTPAGKARLARHKPSGELP